MKNKLHECEHQYHQHSLMEDSAMDTLTMDMLAMDLSEELEPQTTSQPQSPLRKRLKVAHTDETYNVVEGLSLATLADFDMVPVYARNHSKWNQLLAESPHIWLAKCSGWFNDLSTAFKERNVCFRFLHEI